MQRRIKKTHSSKTISPLLPLLPIILVLTVIQAIIAIFSKTHFPILFIDLLFVLFYFCILIFEIQNDHREYPFKNKGDFLKLLGWIIRAYPYINIQVENGSMVIDRPLSNQRKLLFIDPASVAAIFIKRDQRICIVPSGVYCIDKENSLLSIFDLRSQTTLFPSSENAKPVLSYNENTQAEMQIPLQSDFFCAATKDDYQVGAKFFVQYKYDIGFGEGENPYGFNSAVLEKVISGESFKSGTILDAQFISRKRIQQMLLSIWQTSINQLSLLDLIPQENAQGSALENIQTEIQQQLVKKNNTEIHPTSAVQQLQDNGLKILSISFHSLWLPEETEIAIQHHWQPQAKQLVTTYQSYQQKKKALHQEIGEMQALYTFLDEQRRAG